ncbi:MAG: hypothetical protein AB1814_11965 [Thermodesulfobacteriota bacterium]
MPKPSYPTKEGIWSRGQRSEPGYGRVRLGLPYKEAVASLRGALTGREDFDPAVLFVWGTMQATGVLNILKAVEEAFGQEGQEVVRGAINKAGHEACSQMLDNSELPQDLSEVELLSYVVTGLNTILYASLERPWITSDERCEFDILWCPHQDRYSAFDCRVQRYFVEGMIHAIEERGLGHFTAWVDKLIPHGGECCHFVVQRRPADGSRNPWEDYSDHMGRRALEQVKAQD